MKRKTPILLIVLFIMSIFVNIQMPSASTKMSSNSVITLNQNDMESIELNTSSINYVEEQVGDQFIFWIYIIDIGQMRGTLLAKGNWCYIYMANDTIDLIGENASAAKCEYLCSEFDTTIYPKALEVAGNPDGNLGDIDGDPHVTIFLAPFCRLKGDNSILGYYTITNDEIGNPYSNEREMVYVDSEHNYVDTVWITTHEFNHMVWGNYEFDEAEFLTEGLANYNVDYDGYYSWVTEAITTTYTYHPELSLLYFVREYGELWDSSYGQAYLFVTYLADRFGNEFTKKLVSTAADGAEAIDYALAYFGYGLTFNNVYLDWITACTIDELSFSEGIYGFESVDYKMQTHLPIGYTFPIVKHDIEHYYYGFNIKSIYTDYDNFSFEIENPYPDALGISVILRDDSGWNVTQYFNTENSDLISLYVEGHNIQEVYIVTSLMSSDTPSDFGIVYSMSEVHSKSLDCYFYEGKHDTNESNLVFVPIISLVCLFLISRIKRNESKFSQNS